MICPSCGHLGPDKGASCTACGANLQAPVSDAPMGFLLKAVLGVVGFVLLFGVPVYQQITSPSATNFSNTFEHGKRNIWIQWNTKWETAIAESETRNKPIMIFFQNSDTPMGQMMEYGVFQNQHFIEWSDRRVVLMKADVAESQRRITPEQRREAYLLLKKYGIPRETLPTCVFISPDGKVLGEQRFGSQNNVMAWTRDADKILDGE